MHGSGVPKCHFHWAALNRHQHIADRIMLATSLPTELSSHHCLIHQWRGSYWLNCHWRHCYTSGWKLFVVPCQISAWAITTSFDPHPNSVFTNHTTIWQNSIAVVVDATWVTSVSNTDLKMSGLWCFAQHYGNGMLGSWWPSCSGFIQKLIILPSVAARKLLSSRCLLLYLYLWKCVFIILKDKYI